MSRTRVTVVGAGLVGSTAALGLARAGFDVRLIERSAPQPNRGALGVDIRNVALSPASAALLDEGKPTEAADAFSGLTRDASSGYGILAQFYQASIAAKAGNAVQAIELYDRIAGDSSAPESMRGLATVLATLQALKVASITAETIRNKIQPMSGAGKPYRLIALEILALTAQREGDLDTARANYRAIVDDPAAATGIRTRAAQMLNILGAS